MVNIYILFVLLFFNCLIKLIITETTNINIQNKNVNILGTEYNYAIADIELNDELYFYDWVSCPSFNGIIENFNIKSDNGTIIDCSCDYTNKKECPKILDPQCPPCLREDYSYGCLNEWEVLESDILYNFTINKETNFRYKANGLELNGISLQVKPIDGYGSLKIGSSLDPKTQRSTNSDPIYQASTNNNNAKYLTSYQRNYHFNICPSDNIFISNSIKYSWTKDTYYIQIKPLESIESFTFSLILHSIPIKVDHSESKCNKILSTHNCIELNKSYNYSIDGNITKYFTLEISKPNYYYFSFPLLYFQSYIYISNDPLNKFPNINNSNWLLNDEGENNLLLYLEPISDKEPLILYITINSQIDLNQGVFSINDYGLKYQYLLSSLQSIQSSYLTLRGTSTLIIDNGINNSKVYNSPSYMGDSRYFSFSILFPQKELNPLWPPSEYIFKDIFLKIKNQIITYHQFKSKSYQISFLLNQQSTLQILKYQDFETFLNNSTLKFNSNIFNSNGLPLNFEIKFKNSNILNFDCNFNQYLNISQLIDEIRIKLFNLPLEEIDQTTSLIYNLNSLLLSDPWISCNKQVNNFYKVKSNKVSKELKNCPYDFSDPLYNTNPCCSDIASYYECCNPSLVTFDRSINQDIELNRINNQCLSVDCTLSVFSDYNRTISTFDECSISELTIKDIEYQATLVMRECKNVLNAPFCSSDLDCLGYGLGKCSFFNHTCLPDFQVNDKQYIKCILENLSTSTLFYLLGGTTLFNSSTIDQLYNQHLVQDCIGNQSIYDRSLFSFDGSQANIFCNKNLYCLDKTCLLNHDVCFDGFSTQLVFKNESNVQLCNLIGSCPYKKCLYTNSYVFQSCLNQCPELSFCGYCTNNDTDCHNIKEITNQDECENNFKGGGLCLLLNGEYSFVSNREECENNFGSCYGGNCGKICKSAMDGISDNVCIIKSIDSERECKKFSLLAEWNIYYQLCYYPLAKNESECNTISLNQYSWSECLSKSVDDGLCYGTKENLLLCNAVDIPCKSKEECLNSGTCSDQYYFSTLVNIYYTNGLGKCVHNHTYNFTPKTKSCTINEKDSPMGCYDLHPSYRNKYNFDKESCESVEGYKWWVPAKSKEECLREIGCKVEEPNGIVDGMLPFNFKFNEMSKEQCLSCQNTLNQWTNKFQWTNAQWINGIYIEKPKWYTKGFKNFKLENDVFNYQLFYSSIIKSVESQISEVKRAEAFCRIERLQSSLNSLTCSCFSGSGDSNCFNSSSIPILGQIKVCSDQETQFNFDFGLIKFKKKSIQQTCEIISILQVTKEIYSSYIPESLASNFVSYNKPDSFTVLNSKGANIGTLLSDGIKFFTKNNINLYNITICFKESLNNNNNNNNNNLYSIIDFAVQVDENSLPIPLGLNLSLINLNDNLNDRYYCGLISTIPNTSPIYFKINRLENWQNVNKQLFNNQTKGLMYTLAIIFSMVSLFGIYESLLILYNLFKKTISSIQPIQLLIFTTTLFISIRSIYFFLLVNGKLQDKPVLDYILVVLPTFIYFTSFTIIITIWFVIVFLYLRNRANTKFSERFYLVMLLVNLIFYLFFIAIVLVFQYTKFEPNNVCGSRIFIPNQTSNSQKAISLTYAIVQAFFSLIIGSAFIYLGKNLYDKVTSNSKGLSKSSHQNKIFIISIICSIGFLLHCAFVLVLVTNIDSMIFSFLGLIITEILPVISIFYCFNPTSILKQRKFKNNHDNNNNYDNNNIKFKKRNKKNNINN